MAQAPTIKIQLEIEKPHVYVRCKDYDHEGFRIIKVTHDREEAFDVSQITDMWGLQFDCVQVWCNGDLLEEWYWKTKDTVEPNYWKSGEFVKVGS